MSPPAKTARTEKSATRADQAVAELEEHELALPSEPTFALPRLPTNLTDISDEKLMGYMVKFTRFQDYVQGQLALAEIKESDTKSALELKQAQFLAATWVGPSESRVAIQKAEAASDPEVQKLDNAYELARARRKLRAVLFESLGRDAAVVSRELTRRIGREDTSRRTDRFSP
jgi:hypothetical protein